MKIATCLLTTGALFLCAETRSQNLIQNGSFESPGITGNAGPGREVVVAGGTEISNWLVAGSGDIYVHQTPFDAGVNFNPAQDGHFYVDLSGDGPQHATLYQNFGTAVNQGYTLQFYVGSAATSSATIEVKVFSVSSTLLDAFITPYEPTQNGINWRYISYQFQAKSTITQLTFTDISDSDDNSSFIDNVVVSVPEPSTIGIFLVGSSILAFRRSRK